jgi:hypothetical protein
MKFQFRVGNRPTGPVRDAWIDAARDAVDAGYGVFVGPDTVKILDNTQGAMIARLPAEDTQ